MILYGNRRRRDRRGVSWLMAKTNFVLDTWVKNRLFTVFTPLGASPVGPCFEIRCTGSSTIIIRVHK